MARIDITPPEVHRLGDVALDVAHGPLTDAKKAMSEGYNYSSAPRLNGFQTKASLEDALFTWSSNTEYDVGMIGSTGGKLHQTANAIVHGDNHNVDEFKPIPQVHDPHIHVPGR